MLAGIRKDVRYCEFAAIHKVESDSFIREPANLYNLTVRPFDFVVINSRLAHGWIMSPLALIATVDIPNGRQRL
jgi:hypothetical protein